MPKFARFAVVFIVTVVVFMFLPVMAQEAPVAVYGPASPVAVQAPKPASKALDTASLSLKDVLRHTYLYSPTLAAERENLRATHERLPQAQAGWKPIIDANGSVNRTELDGDVDAGADGSTEKEFELSLSQPLYRGGRTQAQTSAARFAIQSRAALLASTEQSVLQSAVASFLDVVRDRALLDLSRNNRDVIARQREATQDRFDVGELTRTDVSQAEARLAGAESSIISALGDLRGTEASFEQITGLRAPAALEIEASVVEMPATLDEALSVAEANNPLIVSANAAHESSKQDIQSVYGELLPEVGFFASINKSYDPLPGLVDDQTARSIGISASMPLYEAGGVRSRVREAKHISNQRYAEILDAKRVVRQTVISNWEALQAASAEIRSRKAQVEAAAVAQEGVREEADLGARTILDTLDADQELLDAQVALVIAQRNETVAQYALLQSMGVLTPQTLGFEEEQIEHSGHLEGVQKKIFDMHVDMLGHGG